MDGYYQDITYQCSAVCWPSEINICATGVLSNKWAPICFVGDLSSSSTGAFTTMCFLGQVCMVMNMLSAYKLEF